MQKKLKTADQASIQKTTDERHKIELNGEELEEAEKGTYRYKIQYKQHNSYLTYLIK